MRAPEIAVRIAPHERKAAERTLIQHSPMANDHDRPATKKDLNELRNELHGDMGMLRDELKGDMGRLREELNGNMDRLRDELVEKMRDMQTEVLRAFHSWASPIEIRLRALPNMEERLGLLEERVSAIERREKRA